MDRSVTLFRNLWAGHGLVQASPVFHVEDPSVPIAVSIVLVSDAKGETQSEIVASVEYSIDGVNWQRVDEAAVTCFTGLSTLEFSPQSPFTIAASLYRVVVYNTGVEDDIEGVLGVTVRNASLASACRLSVLKQNHI
jgi:hypothetical protein